MKESNKAAQGPYQFFLFDVHETRHDMLWIVEFRK